MRTTNLFPGAVLLAQKIMKNFYKHIFVWGLSMCIVSCTMTNNLYVNNPPMGKGTGKVYLGIGTGVKAKIDSVASGVGTVYFSNKVTTSVVLSLGLQYGISNQTDLRAAVYLPGIIGGFGLRAGVQHSFLDSNSYINIALGTDLGFVFSRDSILGIAVNKVTNGAIHADFFLPVSFKIKNDFRIMLTPRYSFNTFYIRKNENIDIDGERSFKLGYPALSLGIRIKYFYFETTVLHYDNSVYPHFGVAVMP